jgi:hypothetical protein
MRLFAEGPTSTADWFRRAPVAIECVIFILTWFVSLELFRPSQSTTDAAAEAVGVRLVPIAQRAARTATETLAVAAGFVVTALLGVAATAFMDFAGEGEYSLVSSVQSPHGGTRADIVIYDEPGGALSGIATEVYLLPATDRWSPRHRGLLIWRGEDIEVAGVDWESEHSISVRAIDSSLHRAKVDAEAYSRSGFTVRTRVATRS